MRKEVLICDDGQSKGAGARLELRDKPDRSILAMPRAAQSWPLPNRVFDPPFIGRGEDVGFDAEPLRLALILEPLANVGIKGCDLGAGPDFALAINVGGAHGRPPRRVFVGQSGLSAIPKRRHLLLRNKRPEKNVLRATGHHCERRDLTAPILTREVVHLVAIAKDLSRRF